MDLERLMSVQKFQVTNSTTFTWSDATLFNGYALAILTMPASNSVSWVYPVLNDNAQRLRVPLVTKLPIREGVFVSDCYLWGNSGSANSLHPPKTKYAFAFYDNSDRLIAFGDSLASLTTDYDLTHAAFTIPTASANQGHTESSPGDVPTVETPTGDIDGANTAFTLSRVPTYLILFSGSNVPLTAGVDYTLTGAALTMTAAPTAAAGFKAYIF